MMCHVIVTEPRPKTRETNDRGKTPVYVIIVVAAAAVIQFTYMMLDVLSVPRSTVWLQ